MSGAQTSTFADPNILYKTLSGAGYQEAERNRLLNQETQQTIGGNNTEMVARAAATLADPTLYPTEEARAAAYPGMVAQLKANGYAPNAPAEYPGLAHIQAAARMGTPSTTQQEWQANIAANRAYTAATGTPATTPASSAAPATPVTPSGGATIGQRQNNPGNLTFAGQPGASPGQGNRFASFPDMPTGVAANADQLALYQTQHGINTVRGAVTRWVGDPKADLGSYIGDVAKAIGVGPDDKIDLTNPDVQAKFIQAQFPHESAGGGFVLNPADVQKGVQMAAANRGRAVQAPGTTVATSGAPPGQPAAPAPYQVASNAPVPPPASTAPAAGDLVGPRPLPPMGPGSPVVTSQSLANTPAPQPQAQVPQPPANRVMPGSADGPPAATPPAPVQPAPAGGPQPPQLQPLNARGLTAQQQAQIDAVASTGRMTVQQRMTAEQAFVNQNIQLQQKQFSDWIQVQQLQTSQGQLSVSQQNSALEYWKAAHPDAKVTMTGGEIITQNPRTGEEIAPRIQVTPQRADTAAMAIVSRLGPKVANGTATPDEQAQYAVAVDSYRQPALRENPVTKETVRVNTRELPAGFPEPPGLRGAGPGGASGGTGGSNVVIPGYSPQQQEIERDPAKYKVSETQYTNDAQDVRPLAEAGRQAQADQVRIKEMQDVLQRFSTGSGTEARTAAAAFFQRWLPSALTGWEKTDPNLSGSDAAQAFSKLALVGAGTQERGVLGARGGYQAIKLFKDANPSINLQDATNKSILDMQLISNQANQDYTQAALSHFADNEKKFAATHQYDSLTQFDRNWNAQRNPQVYAAAMGAVSGQPAAQWTKGLSDVEYDRALQIVSRANPAAVINTKSGRYSMQPQAVTDGTQIKPNDTVIRYDHSGNRLP